jgi:small GTP-binding protein
VVLAGPPNAGKSSLANALIGRQACIVTDTPGATRDWVREMADVAGCPVWVTDTAGLWSPQDPLDAEAVARAWARIDSADLVLAVFDAANPPRGDDPDWRRLLARPNVLIVANKADLLVRAGPADEGDALRPAGARSGTTSPPPCAAASGATSDMATQAWPCHPVEREVGCAALLHTESATTAAAVSAVTLAGLAELRRTILRRLGLADLGADSPAAFTARQAGLLGAAADALAAGQTVPALKSLRDLLQ